MAVIKGLAIFLMLLGSSTASIGGYLGLSMLSPGGNKLSGFVPPDFSILSVPFSKVASAIPNCASTNNAAPDCKYLNFRPAKGELQSAAAEVKDLGAKFDRIVAQLQHQLDGVAPQFMALKSVAYGVVGWTVISGISMFASGASLLVISRQIERYQARLASA